MSFPEVVTPAASRAPLRAGQHTAWPLLPLRMSVRAALITAAIMGATTLAAFIVRPARGEVSGALIFVVGITLAGSTLGLGASLAAAAVGFLLYNFYFAEPVLTFRLDTVSDLTPLIIFNVSAIISGILAGRVRDQARAAAIANDSLTALLQISEILQSAVRFEDIEHALAGDAAAQAGVRLLTGDMEAMNGVGRPFDDGNWDTGLSTARVRVAALPRFDMQIYRIECGAHAIALMIAQAKSADRTEATLGSALANLVALALERATLSSKIAEAEALARTESLKSALLSSVSHDLRTPLATISASASSLIAYRDRLQPDITDGLLQRIMEESDRLNRFTANLLHMTKLEAGQHPSSAQIVSTSDMLSIAVRSLRPRLGNRIIERVDNEDCLILADPSLFELVIQNVLENAVLYSEDGTRIRISLPSRPGMCVIEIADEGRGIPDAELERVFERFHRVNGTEQLARGSGLGLAIARGFVRACGGMIEARTPGIDGRGTCIRIELPPASRAG